MTRSLASIHARRGEGIHTLGEIWRGRRLSCPTRHQLGTWLLGTIEEDLARYIAFHVEVVGCRYCQANLADLRAQHDGVEQVVVTRRHKYFQSSAGYLKAEGGKAEIAANLSRCRVSAAAVAGQNRCSRYSSRSA